MTESRRSTVEVFRSVRRRCN